MSQFDNRKLRYGAGAVMESRKPKNLRRAAARRGVKPGYPVDIHFQSREELRAYLDDTQIICLLCGRPFLRLTIHLPRIHGVTNDQYRLKYGIPIGCSLMCAPSRERYKGENLDKSGAYQHLAAVAAKKKPAFIPEWLKKEYTDRIQKNRGRRPRKHIVVKNNA